MEPNQNIQEILDTINQIVQREKVKQHRKNQLKTYCKAVIPPTIAIILSILFSPPLLGGMIGQHWFYAVHTLIVLACAGYMLITETVRNLHENEVC